MLPDPLPTTLAPSSDKVKMKAASARDPSAARHSNANAANEMRTMACDLPQLWSEVAAGQWTNYRVPDFRSMSIDQDSPNQDQPKSECGLAGGLNSLALSLAGDAGPGNRISMGAENGPRAKRGLGLR
jgi:hypothetical protein